MKEERLYYLRRMNAWTKPVDAPPVERRDDAGSRASGGGPGRRAPRPQPTARIEQGTGHRLRLRYTKLGRIAYLGHLDLVRHLPRIFRRAGVELLYSVGFHPHPELSYSPALGLGIPSLGEILDVKVADPLTPDELIARLQAVTLDGIDWCAAVALGDNDRALGRVLAASELWAQLPAGVPAARGLELWRGDEPVRVKRRSEGAGLGRMVDVRRAVHALRSVSSDDAAAAALRARLGWDAPGTTPEAGDILAIELGVSVEASAKPAEIVEALWGEAAAADASFARVGLWGLGGGHRIDPLDVEALRQARAAAPAGAEASRVSDGEEASLPAGPAPGLGGGSSTGAVLAPAS